MPSWIPGGTLYEVSLAALIWRAVLVDMVGGHRSDQSANLGLLSAPFLHGKSASNILTRQLTGTLSDARQGNAPKYVRARSLPRGWSRRKRSHDRAGPGDVAAAVGWLGQIDSILPAFDSLSEQASGDLWSRKWRSYGALANAIDAQYRGIECGAANQARQSATGIFFPSWRKACDRRRAASGRSILHRNLAGASQRLHLFAASDRAGSRCSGGSRRARGPAGEQDSAALPKRQPSCAASRRALQASFGRLAAVSERWPGR